MDDLVEMETHHLGSLLNSLHTSTVFILRISVRKSCKVVFPQIYEISRETSVNSLATLVYLECVNLCFEL